jgi:site-specific DNA-methyltransferase (adenine-specific)
LIPHQKTRKHSVGDVGRALGANGLHGKEFTQEFANYPKSIIRFVRDRNKIHPTQKPVALMEYLIRTYTNEGDTVLDNCMGSGTTGVACQNTGRRFIGIEKDAEYFAIARSRIEQQQKAA